MSGYSGAQNMYQMMLARQQAAAGGGGAAASGGAAPVPDVLKVEPLEVVPPEDGVLVVFGSTNWAQSARRSRLEPSYCRAAR